MGSGGSNIGSAFETIFKDATDATSLAASGLTGGLSKDLERETKPFYDEITGENSRKKEQAEKDASKKQKAAIAGVKKKQEDKKKLDSARTEAEDSRDSKTSRPGSKKRKGRSSTILTDSLGGAGGSENQGKKNLLGL